MSFSERRRRRRDGGEGKGVEWLSVAH